MISTGDITLRPYQQEASDAIREHLSQCRRTLAVMPTGCGKTIVFAHVIKDWFVDQRILVMAHRDELIQQGANKIHAITGEWPDIEQAEYRADQCSMWERKRVVVTSVQTMCREDRHERFHPDDFGLMIIDEAHHCHVKGTKIETTDGSLPIEDVEIGSQVWGWSGKDFRPYRVMKKFAYWHDGPIVDLLTEDGGLVSVTLNHKLYRNGEYVHASELRVGDCLSVPDLSLGGSQSLSGSDAHAVEASGLEALPRMPPDCSVFLACLPCGRTQEGSGDVPRLRGAHEKTCARGPCQYETPRQSSTASRVPQASDAQAVAELRLPQEVVGQDATKESYVLQGFTSGDDRYDSAVGSAEGDCSVWESPCLWERWISHPNGTRNARLSSRLSFQLCCGPRGRRTTLSLQNRHRMAGSHGGNGDRRNVPRWEGDIGCQERPSIAAARMEDSSSKQQRCGLRISRIAAIRVRPYTGLIYDIEVETVHNYVANGILSSNSVAPTYGTVIDYFSQNENLKILGVTATPDRADELALGRIFETVAYQYGIVDAIDDGWLVPIEQQFVQVAGLDLSSVKTTAGDLNQGQLAKIVEQEEILHKFAAPIIEMAGTCQTLVFAATVAQAERLAEILNRHRPDKAAWLSGDQVAFPRDKRRDILAAFHARRYQYMVNVGVLTEGFDDPHIEVVAVARPTKSRSLYAQMIGRGTRPLPGLVDELSTPLERQQAIATSGKPALLVLDFVGNSGRHKLIHTGDLLGGDYDTNIMDAIVRRAAANGEKTDLLKELREEHARREAEKAAEARKRAAIIAKASYRTEIIDPFRPWRMLPKREPGWHKGRRPTDKMLAVLSKMGVDKCDQLSFWAAKQLLDEASKRRENHLCTYKQAKLLQRYGLNPNVTFEQASTIIDQIARNRWVLPRSLAQENDHAANNG